jgi:diguanylate cyclase (GGDEF)-like protein/PAS domain S-box-containing protein
MWAAIRELIDQFDESIIVLDKTGEIALMNRAASDALKNVSSPEEIQGLRLVQVSAPREPEFPRAEFDAAAANLPVVLSIRNRERYLYTSPAHRRVYGDDPEPFLLDANEFLRRVHPDDRQAVKQRFDADLSGAPHQYECRVLRADGAMRRLHINVRPFFDHGTGELLVASLAEDITESNSPVASRPASNLPGPLEFHAFLEAAIEDWLLAPNERFFAVALVDVARFRSVNDSFGYQAGDQYLREIAQRLQGHLSSRSQLAGFGADRFALLLRESADAAQIEDSLRRLLLVASAPVTLASDSSVSLTVRAGLTFPGRLDCTPDSLLRDADAALQLAKSRRQPLVVAQLSQQSLPPATLEFDLSRALDGDEFYFEFQPVLDPDTGRIQLLEALVRWRHPRLGTISPAAFLSIAEDSGLVLRLDMQGLARLERHFDYWRSLDARFAEIPVSINISGRHFPNFVMERQFFELLRRPTLHSANIIFEITESVFLDSNPSTAEGLQRLRAAGVQIWLDDFGEGHSSFRYLAHFPVDGIKITESFVRHCHHDEKARVILSALQGLARGLGLRTVVEGVENQQQFDTLRVMGFDALQGYFLSPPVSAADIPALVADRGLVRPAKSKRPTG